MLYTTRFEVWRKIVDIIDLNGRLVQSGDPWKCELRSPYSSMPRQVHVVWTRLRLGRENEFSTTLGFCSTETCIRGNMIKETWKIGAVGECGGL